MMIERLYKIISLFFHRLTEIFRYNILMLVEMNMDFNVKIVTDEIIEFIRDY